MTTSLPLRYEKRGAVATITFDRPEARNALTPEMICRLADAVRDFAADDAMRVAVRTGSGDKAFCASGDLGLTLPLMTGARAPADDWDRRVLGDSLDAAWRIEDEAWRTVLASDAAREGPRAFVDKRPPRYTGT